MSGPDTGASFKGAGRSSKTEDESQPGWLPPDQITDAHVRGIFRGDYTTQPTSQHSTR